MLTRHRWLFTASVFLIFSLSSTSAAAQGREGALASYFSTLVQNHRFNGNVLIAEEGNIIYAKSFGYADVGNKRPNTRTSVFPIASITKTFTATAILQLEEQGKLNTNEFVKRYLPEFPYPTVTIRHLLSHTAGMPSYGALFDSVRLANPDTIITNKDILQRYASIQPKLNFEPGDNGQYTNINFIFLAILVEKVTGISFQDYVNDFVLKPAKLTHTFFPKFAFYHYTADEKKNLSLLYRYPHLYSDAFEKTDTIAFISKYWHNYNFNGFGELLSTTEDLLKYDQALDNGTLLNEKTLSRAFKQVRLNSGADNPVGNGLGWQIERDSTWGRVVLHGGGAVGLSCVLMRNVTKRQTIIVIDNMHSQDDLFVNGIARDVMKMLNGKSVPLVGRSMAEAYGRKLINDGPAAAGNFIAQNKYDTVHYRISEDEFNRMGYDLMNSDKLDAALEVFRMNVELFPSSYNGYDSYGEALLKKGRKKEAIAMYTKSVSLKPDSPSGLAALKYLTGK
jgi:CubicO group peptidase (beta-lactamase class C family)